MELQDIAKDILSNQQKLQAVHVCKLIKYHFSLSGLPIIKQLFGSKTISDPVQQLPEIQLPYLSPRVTVSKLCQRTTPTIQLKNQCSSNEKILLIQEFLQQLQVTHYCNQNLARQIQEQLNNSLFDADIWLSALQKQQSKLHTALLRLKSHNISNYDICKLGMQQKQQRVVTQQNYLMARKIPSSPLFHRQNPSLSNVISKSQFKK
ncbi:Hypothetical_protein [Hexamita inflata]|uniref:Hypothetical_protein n=1 Tax=Hexamita inflata TaxID=28002 RepID=A0AA86NR22_9EUKA|nr:Hypothetical protein HINF_LOCUS12070 [Hexamita inflata]